MSRMKITVINMEDKITPIRKNIIEKTRTRDNRKEQLQSIEDAVYIDVLEQSKDKEYAKEHNLTNEKGRSIALKERLSQDDDYQLLLSSYEILSLEVETLNVELERERNKFKVWYVGELNKMSDRI